MQQNKLYRYKVKSDTHKFHHYSNTIYTMSQKNGPPQLIRHNFTNSQCSLIILLAQRDLIQFSIHVVKKFLNWLGTGCVVSIATVST